MNKPQPRYTRKSLKPQITIKSKFQNTNVGLAKIDDSLIFDSLVDGTAKLHDLSDLELMATAKYLGVACCNSHSLAVCVDVKVKEAQDSIEFDVDAMDDLFPLTPSIISYENVFSMVA